MKFKLKTSIYLLIITALFLLATMYFVHKETKDYYDIEPEPEPEPKEKKPKEKAGPLKPETTNKPDDKNSQPENTGKTE